MIDDNKKKQEDQLKENNYAEDDIDVPKEEKLKEVAKEEKTVGEKLKETEEKLLRSLAEIENQRRRFEKEVKDAFDFGSFNFAKESLAILDNLQRAKESIKNDENLKLNKDFDKFLENIIIVEKDLVSIFEKNRIKKIDTKNRKFDPNIHQALSEIEDKNSETGNILEEIQAGYMLSERLLRPALVVIAKKNTLKNEAIDEKKEES